MTYLSPPKKLTCYATFCFLLTYNALFAIEESSSDDAKTHSAEVIVYGGTPAGVMSAVAAARHGHSVILIDLNHHLGGVVSGGLCESDLGDRKTVGGLAAEFFNRIWKYYTTTYGAGSPQATKCHKGVRFEPSVSEKVFDEMVQEEQPRIKVYNDCRFKSASSTNGKVVSLVTDCLQDHSKQTFTGDIFIDASYEGDLMAGADVPYRVGREARDEFDESVAGISVGPDKGKPDKLIMAYNYRLCLTSTEKNRALFPKPAHYDPAHWKAIYGPRLMSGKVTTLGALLFSGLDDKAGPNDTYDDNADDLPGGSALYPDGDWPTRDKIAERHRDYILSKLYYLQNDAELPASWRADAQKWGLDLNEFTDNGHFPFQLYIREARRMKGAYVLHLDDLTQHRYKPDGICDGSYGTDCHVVQRLIVDGREVEDFTSHVDVNDYDIPYSCLTPKEHPDNLLVPVCVSATHVAYCSLRMEPVYMMLGHAAGDAAHLALAGKTSVQQVDVPKLRELLVQEKALLDGGYAPPIQVTFTPEHPLPGQTVHFHVETGELKEPLAKIWWDFEGTGNLDSEGAAAKHTFSIEKIYHVSLAVEDKVGRRALIPIDVPVGTASPLDVTVDDLESRQKGRWNHAYPILPGTGAQSYSDLFVNAGTSYDMEVKGLKTKAFASFEPVLSRSGNYLVCFAYRPSPQGDSHLPVMITSHGKKTRVIIDEQIKASPFPFVALGTFRCDEGTHSTLRMDNSETSHRISVDAVRWVWVGD